MQTAPRELVEIHDGKMRLNFHRGQLRAWDADARFVLVLAGTQSGKTVFGPHWMRREIERCGPGDYMMVSPTFPLMKRKALPEYLRLFKEQLHLGDYRADDNLFIYSDAGMRRTFGDDWTPQRDPRVQIQFGYAENPNSLESATIKGMHLDECGQPEFKLESWRALRRRGAIHQARALLTTTPYNLGWLKTEVYDRAEAGDPDYEVINFDSIENPAFSVEEFEAARADLPEWYFNMFYRGLFTRPAGLIYGAFSEEDIIAPFDIPELWKRFVGLDFGGIHLCALFYAEDPEDEQLYLYREYLQGDRTAAQHTLFLLQDEPRVPTACGGAGSEDNWRREFTAAGLPVAAPPIKDVEVGINRVYGQHKRHGIKVFATCAGYLAEKRSYSRKTDEHGRPIEEIAAKSTFHHMDAERYIIGRIRKSASSNPEGRLQSLPTYGVNF